MDGQGVSQVDNDTTVSESDKAKGFNDLQDELKVVIDGISSKKTSADTELNQFISKIDESFKDAEDQFKNKTSDLNKKRLKFEQITKTRVESASDALTESLNDFKNAFDFYKNKYFELIIPIAILILCIILDTSYDYIINQYSILSYGVPFIGFPLFKLMTIILAVIALAIIYNNFTKTEKDYKSKSNEISKKKKMLDDNIKNFDYLIPEEQIEQVQITDLKPFFLKANQVCEDLIVNVVDFIPFARQKFDDMTILIQYQKMVENFKSSLEYYGLLKDDNIFIILKKKAPAEARIINDERYWEQIIGLTIAKRIMKDKKTITPRIVQLIYYEHNGQDSTNIYRTILNQMKNLNVLLEYY